MNGHRQKRGKNSQSINDGKYIDCSCGEYRGGIFSTWEKAKVGFDRHIANLAAE